MTDIEGAEDSLMEWTTAKNMLGKDLDEASKQAREKLKTTNDESEKTNPLDRIHGLEKRISDIKYAHDAMDGHLKELREKMNSQYDGLLTVRQPAELFHSPEMQSY